MKAHYILFGALVGALATGQAAGQSVTTFGSSYASECYRNAAADQASAVSACDEALKEALADWQRKAVLVNRGILHKRNGDLKQALDDFNAALDLDPELAEAYLNRGSVYLLAGHPERAIEDYERSLDLGTQRPWAAWYNIGLAYESLDDREKAREAFSKSAGLNQRFADALRKLREYE